MSHLVTPKSRFVTGTDHLKPIVIGAQYSMRARYCDKLKARIDVFEETGYIECLFPNGRGGFHVQAVRPSRLKERWGIGK